jgi:hypothetical protein
MVPGGGVGVGVGDGTGVGVAVGFSDASWFPGVMPLHPAQKDAIMKRTKEEIRESFGFVITGFGLNRSGAVPHPELLVWMLRYSGVLAGKAFESFWGDILPSHSAIQGFDGGLRTSRHADRHG